MNIDMHFHSNKSDGRNSPFELLNIAKQRNLDFVALTDHDKISDDFSSQAINQGIISCNSCEISARNLSHNKSIHLTIYAKKIGEDIKNIVQNTIINKVLLIKNQVAFLNEKGFKIDYDDFCKFAGIGNRKVDALNKFDLANYIFSVEENKKQAFIINGGPISIEKFYLKYLKRGGEGYKEYGYEIDEYEPSLEVCKNIKERSNGILSIAHPNFTFKKSISEFENTIVHYIDNGGINAVEINSKATYERVQAILRVKEKYGLYITFGSDNHKIGVSDEKHGDFGELNNFITNEQISKYFNEYKELLIK